MEKKNKKWSMRGVGPHTMKKNKNRK